MSNFRSTFARMLRVSVNNAVTRGDEIYGKQLATMFEKASIVLRHRFGGRSVWQMERKRPKVVEEIEVIE